MCRKIQVAFLMPVLIAANSVIAAEPIEPPNAFSDPSPAYLRSFASNTDRMFVLERFDAAGGLVSREIEVANASIMIGGATQRTIAGHEISLRGLRPCPDDVVNYNGTEKWECEKAAADYAGAIYNQRANVILCKTLVLDPKQKASIPASCFALVGGNNEPFRVANDDDAMVFLGLAEIEQTDDGLSRRPDLEHTQSLSKGTEHQDAQ